MAVLSEIVDERSSNQGRQDTPVHILRSPYNHLYSKYSSKADKTPLLLVLL
jgi:hypothetical protein